MDPRAFQAFTSELTARLEERPEVLGLVFLGSAAGVARAPDRFSDHDFFVFVEDAAAERYRTDLSWLPESPALVLSHRETEHGLKLLLAGGHVAELAVFTREDLRYARGDTWRVALDRGLDLEEAMAGQARAVPPPVDPAWQARQLLFALLIGAGRHRRGEKLAGHRMVFGDALPRLVELLSRPTDGADPFDPLRRFEQRRPELAARLARTLLLPADAAALELLAVAAEELAGTEGALPARAVAEVRSALGEPGA